MNIAKELAVQDPSVRLFNCTEGGAFIEGYKHLPLKDWASLIEGQVDVPLQLASAFSGIDWTQRDKRLQTKVKQMKTQLREVNRLARECRAAIDEPNKLDKIEKRLIKSVEGIPFVAYLMQEHLGSQMLRNESIQTAEAHTMVALSLYQLIIDACEDCLGIL